MLTRDPPVTLNAKKINPTGLYLEELFPIRCNFSDPNCTFGDLRRASWPPSITSTNFSGSIRERVKPRRDGGKGKGPPYGLSTITQKILKILTRRFQYLSEHSLCASSEKIKSKVVLVQKLWRSNWGHVRRILAEQASSEKTLDLVWPSCDVTGKENKFNRTVSDASWKALSNTVRILPIRVVVSEIWGEGPLGLTSGRVIFLTPSERYRL